MKLLVAGSKSLKKIDITPFMPSEIDLIIGEDEGEIACSVKAYAQARNIPFLSFKFYFADDSTITKFRGLSVDIADFLLVFWDGESADMLEYAECARKSEKLCAHVIYKKPATSPAPFRVPRTDR